MCLQIYLLYIATHCAICTDILISFLSHKNRPLYILKILILTILLHIFIPCKIYNLSTFICAFIYSNTIFVMPEQYLRMFIVPHSVISLNFITYSNNSSQLRCSQILLTMFMCNGSVRQGSINSHHIIFCPGSVCKTFPPYMPVYIPCKAPTITSSITRPIIMTITRTIKYIIFNIR